MDTTTIELRAFGKLQKLFLQRDWPQPYYYPLTTNVTGSQLVELLRIPEQEVESIFINGKASRLTNVIQAGDRVGLVPPGTPGVVRFMLGIHE